jgi:hypothetical protein
LISFLFWYFTKNGTRGQGRDKIWANGLGKGVLVLGVDACLVELVKVRRTGNEIKGMMSAPLI